MCSFSNYVYARIYTILRVITLYKDNNIRGLMLNSGETMCPVYGLLLVTRKMYWYLHLVKLKKVIYRHKNPRPIYYVSRPIS